MSAINLNEECKHTNTIMWEPHLAGARKCMDCGRVRNPNMGSDWFYEKKVIAFATDSPSFIAGEDLPKGSIVSIGEDGLVYLYQQDTYI